MGLLKLILTRITFMPVVFNLSPVSKQKEHFNNSRFNINFTVLKSL